jgi:hypothetical protein
MQVDLNNNELWKILDAIKAYKKDYSVTHSVEKLFDNLEKKLKVCVSEKK